MRKLLPVLLLMLVAVPAANAGITALATLNDFDDIGLGARWEFPFPITATSFALSGTYFFDGEYIAADGDVHFQLSGGAVNFYPLAGLQFATDFDNSDLNINVGGGFGFNMGNLGAFAEGKFVIGDADYFAATLGVRF